MQKACVYVRAFLSECDYLVKMKTFKMTEPIDCNFATKTKN